MKPRPDREGLEKLRALCQHQKEEVESLRREVSHLKEEADKNNSKCKIVSEISTTLIHCTNLDHLLQTIVELVAKELEVEHISLMLIEGGHLRIHASKGLSPEIVEQTRVLLGDRISGYVAEQGEGALVENIDEDERFRKFSLEDTADKSLVSVPIKMRRKTIGVINLREKRSGAPLTLRDKDFLETIADQTAIAYENYHLLELHRIMAVTDGLTGLYNYRHFQEALTIEIERSKRYKIQHFSLIMSDIDYFKDYNDLYGHQEGDRLLKAVSEILLQEARKVDLVCRYGGEEFAIILPGVGKMEAKNYADRVKRKLAVMDQERDDIKKTVTLSFGIAEFPGDGKDPQTLIKNADNALYKAKYGGRSRIEVFGVENRWDKE